MAFSISAGAIGQARSKQLNGCISAGTSTVKPVSWASFSADLRFAWHSNSVGLEGAHGYPLMLQLSPSQTLQS